MQQGNEGTVHYELVKEEGPQHEKVFEVEVYVGEKKRDGESVIPRRRHSSRLHIRLFFREKKGNICI